MKKRAVCLLSGGLDSSTCLAVAKNEGYDCYAISFDYGQRHRVEIQAAAEVAEALGVVDHLTVPMDLRPYGGSALTADIAVPKDRAAGTMAQGIPITYVPARNTIFLAHALAWAEVVGAEAIFIGVNSIDYSGYPDCRPEFIEAFEKMANLATRAGVEGRTKIHVATPLAKLSKAGIIRLACRLDVPLQLTHSCYDPDASGRACGHCDSCLLRLKGFREVGLEDPVEYQA